MNYLPILAGLVWITAFGAAKAAPQIQHDAENKCVTMTDSRGGLLLRLRYDGRCMLDRIVVHGTDVVSETDGVCSSICVGGSYCTTRVSIPSPTVEIADNTVTVRGIHLSNGGIQLQETWTFDVADDSIDWRITRKYLVGGTQEDTGFPSWGFKSLSTWTGAILGTGGIAWFKLFHCYDKEWPAPLATYGVHAGTALFWNQETRTCLQVVPTAPSGRHVAMKFCRQPGEHLSCDYCVTEQAAKLQHGHYRYLRDRQDVWAPVQVSPEEISVAYRLSTPAYAEALGRGIFHGVDGAAVQDLCNTIGRIGVIDHKLMGSNGWYSGYICLQEQWLAQLGLAIDDPAYTKNYTATLDYERNHAIGPDGRVKARWGYGSWDSMPGTYDDLGFYEAQWGYFLDSQPDWVIDVSEQFDFNGDLKWLRTHKATCERVLDYMLRRDSNHNGLVEIMTDSHTQKRGGDWLDVVWTSFEAASVNAQMYYALTLWTDCEDLLGDRDHAAQYRAAAARLKTSFNKTTAEGGFWNPDRKWYVHWRDKDGSVHGDNLVLPVNFMAIAYGLCDDQTRRDAILAQTEAAMQKEHLFFWPTCIYSYKRDEGHDTVNWPFPAYENGDIFLAWGEVGIRAYAQCDPAIAVRYVTNVLDQYRKDGLAFQRYLRRSQRGTGSDILSNNACPVVGLYRNIYGIQPKWNRLYLDPHLTPELNGTQIKYWLRDQRYTIDLSTQHCRIAANDFAVSENRAFGVNVNKNTAEYFSGDRKLPSMSVNRSAAVPMEICIKAWPLTGVRQWSETYAKSRTSVRHVLSDLAPATTFKLSRNGAPAEAMRSDAAGSIEFEHQAGDSTLQTFELAPWAAWESQH